MLMAMASHADLKLSIASPKDTDLAGRLVGAGNMSMVACGSRSGVVSRMSLPSGVSDPGLQF